MSDIFREVDEELQRKQMKRLWHRYGYLVIGGALLIVAFTAGYKGWQAYQESVAGERGDRFIAAVQLSKDGSIDEAKAEFDQLSKDGGAGYALLAKFRSASDLAASGDSQAALAAFDALSRDPELDAFVQNVARIRAAYLAVDLESYESIISRIGDLAEAGNPLRFSAREVLGLSAWKHENLTESRERFESLRDDSETPADLRQRANFMLALLKSRLSEEATGEAAEKTATQ